MKLAEALSLRSEYKKKIDNLQQRIFFNFKVQEGEKPQEDPGYLISEMEEISDKMYELIKKINKKNNEVILPTGQLLADILIERDSIIKKRQLLNNIIFTASQRDMRVTRSEVKTTLVIDTKKIQADIDSLSQMFRKLDILIQEQNWLVEID